MPLLFGVTLFGLGVLDVTRLLFILWHSANRATRASCRGSSASVCPFHLQDGRFIASTLAGRHFMVPHPLIRPGGRVVSAPLPRLSPYAREGVAILRVGGVSSDPADWIRKPHTNSPAQNLFCKGNQ